MDSRPQMNVFIGIVLVLILSSHPSEALIEGFYKDVFENYGIGLSGGSLAINCEYIDFTMECFQATENPEAYHEIVIKNSNDENGYLLYPDNAPRFALLYFHGGNFNHAIDLGEEGVQRIKNHYYKGGSIFGSCAGSAVLGSSFMGTPKKDYFKFWSGGIDGPNTMSFIDKIINVGSPLIGYNGIKAGDVIKAVSHQGGGSIKLDEIPSGTEICAIHSGTELDGYGAVWTWKESAKTGRLLGHTDHPEGVDDIQQIKYITASMLLLKDGLGLPTIKHTLENQSRINMDKHTSDNDPLYTKIGDKQYHHFKLGCKEANDVTFTLTGKSGYDFHLFIAKNAPAFKQNALYSDTKSGNSKTLSIPKLDSGDWYVGVKLNTTVDTEPGELFPKYTGNLEVLQGIAYSIQAKWNKTNMVTKHLLKPIDFGIQVVNNHTICINSPIQSIQDIQIFTLRGKLCKQFNISSSTNRYVWQPNSSGVYLVKIRHEHTTHIKSVTLLPN